MPPAERSAAAEKAGEEQQQQQEQKHLEKKEEEEEENGRADLAARKADGPPMKNAEKQDPTLLILRALAGGRAQTLAGLVLSLHCALDDLTDHRSLLERINHERAVASNGTNAAAAIAARNAKRRMPLDATVVKRILDQLVREATVTVLPGGLERAKAASRRRATR